MVQKKIMKNAVTLKIKKDRLKIYLDADLDIELLKEKLVDKITEIKDFIGKTKIAIEFSGRKISEQEEDEFLDIIMNNSDIEITYVFSNEETDPKLKIILENLKGEEKVKIFKGMVRSGTLLQYDGTVIILGDVNPGGAVRATGSIIVLGYLNGSVHAGFNSDKKVFVGAIYMNPVQIRIGNCIAINPNSQLDNNKKIKRSSNFEIAYVKENKIFLENYSRDLLRVL